MDFELEIGAFLGGENGKINQQGHPIKANHAKKYIFGFVLVNDWSARDIQTWE
jgi:fumarylacetoacetase